MHCHLFNNTRIIRGEGTKEVPGMINRDVIKIYQVLIKSTSSLIEFTRFAVRGSNTGYGLQYLKQITVCVT